MFSKKTRKKLSVVITLILTAGLSLSGTVKPKVAKADDTTAKKVIYFIADGMSDSVLTASRYYKDIQDGSLDNTGLAMDSIRTGFVKTSWANGPITDSAPAGTALSSAYKTNPGVVGYNTDSEAKATILEAAELKGLATGIIATCELPHATPGAFSAHAESRSDYNSIMKQQVYQDMEVVLGGGTSFFSADGGGKRSDGIDLIEEVKNLGYDYVTTKSELEKSSSDKLWGLFAPTALEYDFDRQQNSESEEPSLKEMTAKAIETLEKDEDGFFLMVEGSKIDWAAHANDPAGTIGDILAFDEAVGYAVDYAKEHNDTIVVVTTDHANSGFSIGNENTSSGYDNMTFEDSIMKIKDFSLSAEKFNTLAKDKSDAEISALITKYYGFTNVTPEEIALAKEGKINQVLALRANIGYTTGGHTGGDVYLGCYAPACITKLRGTVDNTELPSYLAENLGLNLEEASNILFSNVKEAVKGEGATFKINSDDPENPYVEIAKEDVVLKLKVNSNLADVFTGKEVSTEELSGVTVLNSENQAFGCSDEIVKLLNKALVVDNGDNNNNNGNDNDDNAGTNESNSNGLGLATGTKGSNKGSHPIKTGDVAAVGVLAMLGLGTAGVIKFKKKK